MISHTHLHPSKVNASNSRAKFCNDRCLLGLPTFNNQLTLSLPHAYVFQDLPESIDQIVGLRLAMILGVEEGENGRKPGTVVAVKVAAPVDTWLIMLNRYQIHSLRCYDTNLKSPFLRPFCDVQLCLSATSCFLWLSGKVDQILGRQASSAPAASGKHPKLQVL